MSDELQDSQQRAAEFNQAEELASLRENLTREIEYREDMFESMTLHRAARNGLEEELAAANKRIEELESQLSSLKKSALNYGLTAVADEFECIIAILPGGINNAAPEETEGE